MDIKDKIDLDLIISQLPGHVYWHDRNNIFLGCNDKQAKTMGLKSRHEIVGKTIPEFQTKENGERILNINNQVMQTGKIAIVEEPFINLAGQEEIYLSQKVPLFDKNQNVIGILGISFDITSMKVMLNKIESLQKRTEKTLTNIVSNMPGHVYWKDLNGTYLGCNEKQAISLGFESSKDIIGKTDYDLSPLKIANELRAADIKIMQSGQAETFQEISTLKDGKEAVFLSKKEPLRDDNDNIIGVLGISFDITEQKNVERKLIETQIRLDNMTIVSASIAHELRTPLASLNVGIKVLSNTLQETIATSLASAHQATSQSLLPSNDAEVVKQELVSMAKEIRASLTFIDMLLLNLNPVADPSKIEIFSIQDCITEALARYHFSAKQQALLKFQKDLGSDFQVKSERLLIAHIIFNLVKNALYYVQKAGKGEIILWTEKTTEYNILYFKDTGTGISADALPHIFEQFFSNTYHGAGVGLTFCQWAMNISGGTIDCESVEGEYTLFTLRFPCLVGIDK